MTVEGICGGVECDSASLNEVRTCGAAAQNCVFGMWSQWSDCSKGCGTGQRSRSRGVTLPASCGGTCAGAGSELEECNTQACVDACAMAVTCSDCVAASCQWCQANSGAVNQGACKAADNSFGACQSPNSQSITTASTCPTLPPTTTTTTTTTTTATTATTTTTTTNANTPTTSANTAVNPTSSISSNTQSSNTNSATGTSNTSGGSSSTTTTPVQTITTDEHGSTIVVTRTSSSSLSTTSGGQLPLDCAEIGSCEQCVSGATETPCAWCIVPRAVDEVFNTANGVCVEHVPGTESASICNVGLPVLADDESQCPVGPVLLTTAAPTELPTIDELDITFSETPANPLDSDTPIAMAAAHSLLISHLSFVVLLLALLM